MSAVAPPRPPPNTPPKLAGLMKHGPTMNHVDEAMAESAKRQEMVEMLKEESELNDMGDDIRNLVMRRMSHSQKSSSAAENLKEDKAADAAFSSMRKSLANAGMDFETYLGKDKRTPGAVGVRGTIGKGKNARPIRLDTDEPETAEALSSLVREVRQSVLTESVREMDLMQKRKAVESEMKTLNVERLQLPMDITDIPPEISRQDEIKRWRHRVQRSDDKLKFIPNEQRRSYLHDVERAMLMAADDEARAEQVRRQKLLEVSPRYLNSTGGFGSTPRRFGSPRKFAGTTSAFGSTSRH